MVVHGNVNPLLIGLAVPSEVKLTIMKSKKYKGGNIMAKIWIYRIDFCTSVISIKDDYDYNCDFEYNEKYCEFETRKECYNSYKKSKKLDYNENGRYKKTQKPILISYK